MPSRRDLLKMGLWATPAMSLGHLAEAGVGDPGSPPVFPFTRPLAIPPTATTSGPQPGGGQGYEFDIDVSMANIIQGRPTPVWTYDGSFPGPTIRATAGQPVTVRYTNNLAETMSVHLHGGHVPAVDDGHPTNNVIVQGANKLYTYPNNQLPAPLWYHDHIADLTGPHVYMGLAGFYIMTDAIEQALNLPGPGPGNPFRYDVPLMVQDKLFNRNGTLSYPLTEDALIRGVLGDRILVNGVIQPFFAVDRRKYRFRLLNASNARIFDFALTNGLQFQQIGSDGGLFDAPVTRSVIRLAPAERADVVIDFTGVPENTEVFLRNLNRMIPLTIDRAPRNLMRFDVGPTVADSSEVRPVLRPFVPPPTTGVTDRQFTLTRGTQNGRTVWFINSQLFDPAVILAPNITRGTTERWTFINNSNISHPMHIHLVQFVVEGAGPGDNRWKDTVNVPPGGTMAVRAQFNTFAGTYVFHCHVLEHEDHKMMAQFSTI